MGMGAPWGGGLVPQIISLQALAPPPSRGRRPKAGGGPLKQAVRKENGRRLSSTPPPGRGRPSSPAWGEGPTGLSAHQAAGILGPAGQGSPSAQAVAARVLALAVGVA